MIFIAGEALIDLVPQSTGILAPCNPFVEAGPATPRSPWPDSAPGPPCAPESRPTPSAGNHSRACGKQVSMRQPCSAARSPRRSPPPPSARTGRHGMPSTSKPRQTGCPPLRTAFPSRHKRSPSVPAPSSWNPEPRRTRGCPPRGLFTALDPNIRAQLIDDPDACRTRFLGRPPSGALLKLSEEDAAWLGGEPQEWHDRGAGAAVVTRGGKGLTVFTRDGRQYAEPAEKVEVVDTIGADDTVNAAPLHGLVVDERSHPPRAGGTPAT